MQEKIIEALGRELHKKGAGSISAAARSLGWQNSGSLYTSHYVQNNAIKRLLVAVAVKSALFSIARLMEKHGDEVVFEAFGMVPGEIKKVVAKLHGGVK